jgi:DNA-binding winged helix-turn-helix (wHTH) protein
MKIEVIGVVSDTHCGTVLSPTTDTYDSEYADLAGAALVMIAAGANENAGGAADRNNPVGRLRNPDMNVAVHEEILPELFEAAPPMVVLVVTDRPGDDYVTKPFGSRELIARVRTLLRHSQIDQEGVRVISKAKTFRFAGWRLEPSSRQLFDPEDVRLSLTSTEFDLLLAFCQNAGRILSRDQLLALTHSGAAGPRHRSIDVHVSRVRQKLENDSPDVELIKTVRLGGYIFTSQVEVS